MARAPGRRRNARAPARRDLTRSVRPRAASGPSPTSRAAASRHRPPVVLGPGDDPVAPRARALAQRVAALAPVALVVPDRRERIALDAALADEAGDHATRAVLAVLVEVAAVEVDVDDEQVPVVGQE